MKSVLMSIQPKWCELIANGKKTIEVRKTKPKIKTPFKVYIYCSQDNAAYIPSRYWWKADNTGFQHILNGKVIGEFVCDRVDEFRVFENKSLQYWNFHKLENSCLSYKEVGDYIGANKNGYAWHISDLVIYDKPKELSEFSSGSSRLEFSNTKDGFPWKWSGMTRPPQSWCYVEGSDNICTAEDCEDILKLVAGLPTADVVPVVRCKDCEFYNNGSCNAHLQITTSVKPDDYCSYGERRCEE